MKKFFSPGPALCLAVSCLALVFGSCDNPSDPAASTPAETKSTNAALASLTVNAGTLTPAFSATITDYTLIVPAGTTSVIVTGTKADAKATVTEPVTITGVEAGSLKTGEITVTAESGAKQTYTVRALQYSSNPNETPIILNLAGDDADKFKLELPIWIAETTSPRIQNSPAVWYVNLPEEKEFSFHIFIDENNDNVRNMDELDIQSHYFSFSPANPVSSNTVKKSTIEVTVSGNQTLFSNPKIVMNSWKGSGYSQKVFPVDTKNMAMYYLDSNTYISQGLTIFADLDNDNIHDENEYFISDHASWEIEDSSLITLTLLSAVPQILPDGEKIDFDTIESDKYADYSISAENTGKYGFITKYNKIMFIIPIGKGTDGDFITCYFCETNPPRKEGHTGDHFWNLLEEVYKDNPTKVLEAFTTNWPNQMVQFKQNIIDAVNYLEDVKGFTVFGKDLIGLE